MNEKNKTKSSIKQNLKQIMISQTNQFEVLNQDIDSLIQRLEFNDLLAAEQIESNKNLRIKEPRYRTPAHKEYNKRYKVVQRAIQKYSNNYQIQPSKVQVRKSQYKFLNNTTKQYTEDLGLALVADDDIKKEETIEFHIGKAILESEFKKLKKEGKAKNSVEINKHYVYNYGSRVHCRASYANDPRNVQHKKTHAKAVENARLVVNHQSNCLERLVRLQAITDIEKGEEIFVNYGHQYFTRNINSGDAISKERKAKKTAVKKKKKK